MGEIDDLFQWFGSVVSGEQGLEFDGDAAVLLHRTDNGSSVPGIVVGSCNLDGFTLAQIHLLRHLISTV